MARDNAACNRAIRKAWARERELVLAGKGSRNWTPEQREQLITKGKVYDADGKAFIGQHMKSVSGFPDNQGDADNIQLLSQEEHLEAHKGNWHNVTNWYYDPDTKTFYDFEVYDYSKFPPDDYINFRPEEAIIPVDSSSEESQNKPAEEKRTPEPKTEKTKSDISPQKQSTTVKKATPPKAAAAGTKATKKESIAVKRFKSILGAMGRGAKKLGKGVIKYRKEIGIGLLTLIRIAAEEQIRKSGSESNGHGFDNDDDKPPFNPLSDSDEAIDDIMEKEQNSDISDGIGGTPKSPGLRKGYLGHRWKKNDDGELELQETWIRETYVHPEQKEDDDSDE